jgi:FkbM family methyltransferase
MCPARVDESGYGRFRVHAGDRLQRPSDVGELEFLLSLVRPGDIVLEIGAHVGSYAVPIARRVGQAGHVYAFEGAADTFALLKDNIAANDAGNVTAEHAVVSDLAIRNWRLRRPDRNSGATKLLPPQAAFADPVQTQEVEVPAVSIDEWDQRVGPGPIDVMKIDVEGAEVSVLRSAEGVIARDRPLIFCEVSELQLSRFGNTVDEVDALLTGFGYSFYFNLRRKRRGFRLARARRLRAERDFFNVAAVPPDSTRRPRVPWSARRAIPVGALVRSLKRRLRHG